MLTLHGLDTVLSGKVSKPIMTLGTFDGVHVGHQAVLSETVAWARSAGRPSAVLTFEGQPRRVVSGEVSRLLIPLDSRLARIASLGLDAAIVLPFTAGLAAMPPEAFARDVLASRLGARGIVLGHDAAFGRNRRGDAALLRRLGPELGIEVRELAPVLAEGAPVSASRIRTLVEAGDVGAAARLLGRPPALIGTVVRGRGEGRGLGFPTANLELLHDVRPPDGVWAGLASLDGRPLAAVISIGVTPTFGEGLPVCVEVHLLDYEGDLYGLRLEVDVIARIRGQERFDGAVQLAEAIRKDVDKARLILAGR